MPYISRDPTGRITGVFDQPSDAAPEQCRANDPEVLQFLGVGKEETQALDALAESDVEMVRVVEDLIMLLIEKRVIMLTDLPKAAQKKLARRSHLRTNIGDYAIFEGEAEEVLLP